ncbi:hypothetical protein [Yinghuangia seranimata]|uniref:hypothetical protein n=1 Tax=Yinghuangia seranimata TaxID=408067 RepID=UPI00248B0464|nr:hypothetical protein [Yinghuangia seranimata]MDI2129449.1 hypothetical protein [Yinghuangia seranimata]
MSARCLFSAIGFYPVKPASGEYVWAAAGGHLDFTMDETPQAWGALTTFPPTVPNAAAPGLGGEELQLRDGEFVVASGFGQAREQGGGIGGVRVLERRRRSDRADSPDDAKPVAREGASTPSPRRRVEKPCGFPLAPSVPCISKVSALTTRTFAGEGERHAWDVGKRYRIAPAVAVVGCSSQPP